MIEVAESAARWAVGLVLLAWIGFACVFLLRKRQSSAPSGRQEPSAWAGIVLQGVAFALVWSLRRPVPTPLLPAGPALHLLTSVLAVLLAYGSVGLVFAAVRVLGRQWSVSARLVEEHALITTGPYAWVRHPIYTGLFGMLLATGLALSRPAAIAAAIPVFWVGTRIRTRLEEKLLREGLGPAYEAYASRVRGLLPWPPRPKPHA